MTINADAIPFTHSIKVGTGYNDSTSPWSIINPTQNINLYDYPIETECYFNLITFTNLANRSPLTVVFEFYKSGTTTILFKYVFDIPATSTSWGWYSVVAWIGHFAWEINGPGDYCCNISVLQNGLPKGVAKTTMHVTDTTPAIICTPGALKCIGLDLYVCNTAGTAWTLKQANSPTCATAGAEPNFLLDPKGWVAWFFISAWEAITGFIIGSFKTLLQNINNFQINFMAQLVLFIKDPLKTLHSWLDGVYVALSTLAGQITTGVKKWYDDNLKSTVDAIGVKLTGFRDWIGSGWDSLSAWWTTKSAEVGKWIDDQAGIFKRGWDNTFATWPDLFNTKMKELDDWRRGIVDDQSVLRKDAGNIVVAFLKGWFMEQITNYFNDLLKGLNNEFDNMKKK